MTDKQTAAFMERVMPEPNTGCWLWLGQISSRGYGRMWIRRGWDMLAHRLSYARFVGPVPAGLVIDHVRARGCGNTVCVNPDHLEAVTDKENILRGVGSGAQHARAVVCKHGHNDWYREKRGVRHCRTCNRQHARAYKKRTRGPGKGKS